MPFIIAYITYPNEKEAERIAAYLLKKRIIACANIFPIKSMYWWKGKIEKTNEFVSIVKTRKENWQKLKTEVKKLHPYEVPCIVKINAEGNKEYENWIWNETKKKNLEKTLKTTKI